MAKTGKDKASIVTGAASSSDKFYYKAKDRADALRKIEVCQSSLEAAKAFVLSTPFKFEKTGNSEVDKYVKDLVEINDLKSMNFFVYAKNVLEFIHYGVSITEIVWQEDELDLPYPAGCIKINPNRLIYENGVYKDRKTDKPFDLSKYFIAVESISDAGFETSLLDAIEPICKIILEANKTLPPAIRKYKNNPKIAVLKSTGDQKTDEKNCEFVTSLLAQQDEKTSITVTDLEKLLQGVVADIEKVQNVEDKQEMKIMRRYLGHAELLANSGAGNNTKMIKILEIAQEYKRYRVTILEKAINELLATLVYGRFGYAFSVPYLRFIIDTEKVNDTENIS